MPIEPDKQCDDAAARQHHLDCDIRPQPTQQCAHAGNPRVDLCFHLDLLMSAFDACRISLCVMVVAFLRYNLMILGHDINLAPDIETVGVTSVAGFRWTH